MPTFTAGPNGIDMAQLIKAPNVASIAGSSTELDFLLQNQDTVVMTGSFTISNSHVIAANASQIQYFKGGDSLGFTITNAGISLSAINTFEGNSAGLLYGLVQTSMMTGASTYIGSSATDNLVGMGFGPNTFIGGSGSETYDLSSTNLHTNTITGGSGLNIIVDPHVKLPNAGGPVTVSDHNGSIILTDITSGGVTTSTNISYIEATGGSTYVVAAKVHTINSFLVDSTGANVIGGGQGAIILFQDNQSNYTIQTNGSGVYTVTDLIPGHDGVTTVDTSIGGIDSHTANYVLPWTLQFADKTLTGATAIAAASVVVYNVANTTGQQTTLSAPNPNTTVTGAGYDTLSLSGKVSGNYSITSNGDGSVTVSTTGSSDHVSGVMQIAFADKTLTVVNNNSQNEYIALLYQGAVGRTPDAAGLAGWERLGGALPAAAQALGVYGLSDAAGGYNGAFSIAAGFTNSPEFIAKYGSLSNQQFVTQLYANVLDRAPDTAGLNAWVSLLTGSATREHVLIGFAESPEAIANATVGYLGQSGAHAAWLFPA